MGSTIKSESLGGGGGSLVRSHRTWQYKKMMIITFWQNSDSVK